MCVFFLNYFWHLVVVVVLLLFLTDAAREQMRSQLESVFLSFYFRIIPDGPSTCVRLVALSIYTSDKVRGHLVIG